MCESISFLFLYLGERLCLLVLDEVSWTLGAPHELKGLTPLQYRNQSLQLN